MSIEELSKAQTEAELFIEKEFNWYTGRVEQRAKIVFHKVVKPFCRERKWRFLAGNGTWAFFPPNHRAVGDSNDIDPEKDDPELDAMCDLLNTDATGMGNNLGSLMPDCKDYTEEEES
jgi:hypothetical protein